MNRGSNSNVKTTSSVNRMPAQLELAMFNRSIQQTTRTHKNLFSLCTRSSGIALHSQSQVLIFLFVNHSKFTETFPRKWLTKPTTSLSTTFHFEPFGAIQFDHTRFSGGGTKHMGLQGAAFVHAAIPPFEHPI